MKIHITLVGGQREPVLNGINHTNPDKIYLIHSDSTIEQANSIKKELRQECCLKEFDPTNLDKIYQNIYLLQSELSLEDSITLNLVSGTKHWALAFFDVFNKYQNSTIFLIDQNRVVSNFTDHAIGNVEFDMDKVFCLNGNPLNKTNYVKFSDYTDTDLTVSKKIESIRYCTPFFDLAVVMTEDMKNKLTNQKKGRLEKNGGYIEWEKPNIVNMGLYKNNVFLMNVLILQMLLI